VIFWIDGEWVLLNTLRMNTIYSLIDRVLPLLVDKLGMPLPRKPVRARRIEVQLEFAWARKR
jgi:hypothetical protein